MGIGAVVDSLIINGRDGTIRGDDCGWVIGVERESWSRNPPPVSGKISGWPPPYIFDVPVSVNVKGTASRTFMLEPPVTLSITTEIVAVPAPVAVTSPPELTLIICGFDVLHDALRPEIAAPLASRGIAVSWSVPPTEMESPK
jgi:hypothetical protein